MEITVSVVEDNAAFRESLRILLDGAEGFRCVGAHATAEDALGLLPREKPDVILMDIQLPGQNGVECVWNIKQELPDTPIMMLTAYDDSEMIFNSLEAGACGYMLKRTPPHELLESIRELHRGGSPMSTPIARKVVTSFQRANPGASKLSQLTERENEILALLAKGYRNKEIAESLKISLDTIRTHLRHVYEKLQVQSRTEAVLKFLKK